jgi:hypothetical protein
MDEQAINFFDLKFKEYLIKNFDKDGDGEISPCEALSIDSINCRNMEIISLQGIEFMPNLKYLDCSYNRIDILDCKHNTKLLELRCRNNHSLTSIDVSSCADLEYMNCIESSVTTLDIFRNRKLKKLYCGCSNLDIVNTRNNWRLEVFSCRRNPIREIDVTMNTNLRVLNINECRISNVLLFYNKNLEWFDCRYNDIQHLDLYENKKLKFLKCIGNKSLQSIDANFHIEEVISDIEPTPKSEKDSAKYYAQVPFRRIRHRVAGPFAKTVMDPICKKYKEDQFAASLENKAVIDKATIAHDYAVRTIDSIKKGLIERVSHYDDENNSEDSEGRTYDNYSGSYAQDYENWSDEEIDDALEGDPDNYWNID